MDDRIVSYVNKLKLDPQYKKIELRKRKIIQKGNFNKILNYSLISSRDSYSTDMIESKNRTSISRLFNPI